MKHLRHLLLALVPLFLGACNMQVALEELINSDTPLMKLAVQSGKSVTLDEGVGHQVTVAIEALPALSKADFTSDNLGWTLESADGEFEAQSGSFIVGPSTTSVSFIVKPVRDAFLEGDEVFVLKFSGNRFSNIDEATITFIVKDKTTRASVAASPAPLGFGPRLKDSSAEASLTFTNSGDAPAESLAWTALSPPFAYKGGVFPGVGGNCTASLAGHASCSVVLTYEPTEVNSHSATLTWDYQNPDQAAQGSLALSGSGVEVAAVLGGLPSNPSNVNALNVSVSGTNIANYRYKVGPASSTDCAVTTGYSASVAATTPITDSLAPWPDQFLRICVIGQDTNNLWQPMSVATSHTWTFDQSAPTLTIEQKAGQGDPTNALPIRFLLTFSEAISEASLSESDIVFSGSAAVSGLTLSKIDETHFDLIVSVVDNNGVVRPSVAAGQIFDLAGNGNLASTSTDNQVTYDDTAPDLPTSLAWAQTSPSKAVPLTATWTPSSSTDLVGQSIQFFEDGACASPLGTAVSLSASASSRPLTGTDGKTYTYRITTTDSSGNTALSACSAAMIFDSQAPTLLSFSPATSTQASVPGAVVVKWSEPMSAASLQSLSNWAVTCSGSGLVSIQSATASAADEATIQLNVTAAPADGEVCSLVAKAALSDLAGNAMSADASAAYTLDLPGHVLHVTSNAANGSYKAGDFILIQVRFTEAVTVNTSGGSPTLTLETGTTDRVLSYVGGSSTATLQFGYTVTAGDNSADLDYLATSSFDLAGAVITDSFGSAVPVDLPSPGSASSLAGQKNIVIDTQAPASFDVLGITGGTDATEDEWLTNGSQVTLTWNVAAGTDLYEVEIRSADGSSPVCAAQTTTSTSFTFSSCPVTNGTSYQAIVKALDQVGNMTSATNGPFAFTVNTSAVIATLSGQPAGRTNQTGLNITVGGADIQSYRYKVGPAASTVCSNSSGYSAETPVSQKITDAIAGFGDTTIRVCVIGKNSANVEQLYASATSASWIQDLTAPTLTINQKSGQADPTNALPVEFTVTFSEAVQASSFTAADITQGGTASGITWSLSTSDNIVWSLRATAVTTPGTLVPSLTANKVTDVAGNQNTASTSTDNSVTYELTKPGLTINQASGQTDPTNDLPVEFTLVFTEAIDPSTFTTADITQSGTASGITWSLSTSNNITWSLKATAITTAGTLVPSLAANKVEDVAGNLNLASTSTDNTVNYDLTPPVLASALTWQQTSPANTTAVTAKWTKSTSTDLASQKIQYYTGSACNTASGSEVALTAAATTANFTGTNGSTYTFKIISIDTAGNTSTSACSTALLIDTTAPTITNVTSNKANGAYTVGTLIDVRVTFSEAVDVTGSPVLALNTTPARSATYASGSGTTTLVFNYTVAASDTSADLNYAATNSLTITSASIKDEAGNNATLTLPALAAAGSLGTNKNIVIDTTAPSITSFAVTNSSPTNTTTFGLTSAVSGSPVEYCILQNNTSVASCTWVSGTSLPASFTVTTVNESKTLSAWVRDAAGNVSARVSSAAIVFDNVAPTVTLSGQPTGSSNAYALSIDVGGSGVVNYRYKIGPTASTDCAVSTGYSAEIAVATNITTNISGYANGSVTVCAIGEDAAGNWQTFANATEATWTKNSPNIQFSATTSSISEYNEPDHKVTISIPAAAQVPVSVNYAFSNGSNPTAVNGTDYTGTNGTATIPAGSTSVQITVPIADNEAEEYDETFKITLSSPVGSYLGTNTVHTVTILDDEDPPLVTIQDVYVMEGSTKSFSATLSHPTDKGVVAITWARDTCSGVDCAVVTTDYTMASTSGTANVPSGSTSVSFGSVTAVNNSIDELYKRIPIKISSVTGGTSYVSSATIFISDNDFVAGKDAVQLTAGNLTTCARTSNGKVYCWGSNQLGALGQGNYYSSNTPLEVPLAATATKIVGAYDQACALLSTGAAYCWGRGSHGSYPGAGSLGHGTTSLKTSPTLVSGMSSGVTDIAMGYMNGCVIQSGAVKCWGANNFGIIGDPASVESNAAPVAISVLTSGVSKISMGWTHACAIKSGALYCWGENTNGAVGNGTTTNQNAPLLISGLGSVTDVWANYHGTCAKNSSNQVYCWGNNADYQIVNGTSADVLTPTLMTEFAGATEVRYGIHLCALVSGKLSCKGRNYYGEMGLNEPGSNSINPLSVVGNGEAGVTAFSTSTEGHTCFVRASQVYCTGFSGYGQLGDSYDMQSTAFVLSPDLSTASTVSIQGEAGCGLFSGSVKCWGDNTYYRAGNTLAERIYLAPTQVKTLESGVSKNLSSASGGCALKSGSLFCWGRNYIRSGASTSGNPIMPPGMSSVTDFAMGPDFDRVCAIKSGSLHCWGHYEDEAYLGLPGQILTSPAAATGAGANITKVALGTYHICYVKTDKTVWCAGRGSSGQLGNGGTSFSATPVQVSGVTADEIATSSYGSCARLGSTLKCWGQYPGNGASTATSPYTHTLTGVTKIVGGYYNFCAISNGDAYCWGINRFNQHGLNDFDTNEYHLSPVALTSLNNFGTVTDLSIGTYGICGKVGTNWYCSGAEVAGQLGTNKKPHRLGAVSIAPFP